MAGVLGPVPHQGCRQELRWISRIRREQWMSELPPLVAEFCDPDDPVWFTSGKVAAALDLAYGEWFSNTIAGGRYGPDPIGTHHAAWQHRTGAVATQAVWHAWCAVELNAALGQIGARFATWILEDEDWEDRCSGGTILFAPNIWRANFQQLAGDFLTTPWSPPSFWSLHSPEYTSWG